MHPFCAGNTSIMYSYFNYLKHFILEHIFTLCSILSYYALYNIMYCSCLMTHQSTQTFFCKEISILSMRIYLH